MAYSNETGYPSVTDILEPYVDTKWFKPIHKKRGSEAHRVVGCKLNNSWAAPINPAWQGYVDTIMRWCEENIEKVVQVETRYQDDLYRFTGKLDLVALLLDGRLALIDFKTAVAESRTWKLQTGGYKLLYEKHNPDKTIDVRICVRGREDGSKKALVNEYTDHVTDQNRFLYANDLYHTLKL